MTRDIKDIITDFREIVKPRIAKMLLEANFEGCGKEDKAEFETEFEMILTLAERGATVEPQGDSIRREAVLNTLENMDKVLDENRTVEAYKDLLRECFKVLPPVEQTKWISVKDGLPKKGGIYYVTIQDKNGYRYVAKDRFYYDHKYFKHINYYKCLDSEIIAWQPITEPSPYRGE